MTSLRNADSKEKRSLVDADQQLYRDEDGPGNQHAEGTFRADPSLVSGVRTTVPLELAISVYEKRCPCGIASPLSMAEPHH